MSVRQIVPRGTPRRAEEAVLLVRGGEVGVAAAGQDRDAAGGLAGLGGLVVEEFGGVDLVGAGERAARGEQVAHAGA